MKDETTHMHLLLVSLGPVQDFIASARKCQDLWFGSWLLSELARGAAAGIATAAGTEDSLVFPASTRGASGDPKPAVANKILAIVPGDPAPVAAAGWEAMRDRLAQVRDLAFSKIQGRHFLRDVATRQVADLMEYVWVAVPVSATPDNQAYANARAAAELLLAARKNQRDWGPVLPAEAGGWGAAVPKSSLDGLRESALHEQLFEEIGNHEGRQASPRTTVQMISPGEARQNYHVKKAERLCGVGLLKRVGAEADFEAAGVLAARPQFHSTSNVASAPLRARMARLARTDALDAYFDLIGATFGANVKRLRAPAGQHGLDGRVLYAGQLDALFEENDPEWSTSPQKAASNASRLAAASTALSAGLRSIDVSIEGVPTYYATLLADGDFMGATLDRAGRTAGIEGQKAIARALDAFSTRCRAMVHDHDGSLIYAGGDDVLALCPLHTVLGLASKLHDDFGRSMSDALGQLGLGGGDSPPTLSMGIGIGHHLADMADVRELARGAESMAKRHPGKNALAVVAQPRGGARLEAVGSFGGASPLDKRLAEWVGHIRREEIPGKAAHALEAAVAPLLQGGGDESALSELALSLAGRVLRRSRARRGEEPLSVAIRDKLEARFNEQSAGMAVRRISEELQLSSLLAKSYDVALVPADADATVQHGGATA